MKFDALKQYTKLRQQLLEEKGRLEARLSEINDVLGSETPSGQPSPASASHAAPPPTRVKRGRKPAAGQKLSLREAVLKALSNRPLARNELVDAVERVGFKFTTKDPLNSLGSVLYGKNSQVRKTPEGKFFVEGNAQAESGLDNDNGGEELDQAPTGNKKRKMSRAARARISAAQKARWATRKAGQ